MIVFHHSDLDGRCAAAIVKHFMPDKKIKFIECNYKDDFDGGTVSPDEQVFMVDFSFQKKWPLLLERTKNIVWLDHHDSSLSESGPQKDLPGERSKRGSGAWLVWRYFDPEGKMPRAVELVSDFDTWTHSFPDSVVFMYGTKVIDDCPESSVWEKLLSSDEAELKNIISKGLIVQEAERRENEEFVREWAFEAELDGHSCIVLNKERCGSLAFDSVPDKDSYDILVSIAFDGKRWAVSLYSTKVDCAELCKKHGGGGHKGTGGFDSDEFPLQDCRVAPWRSPKVLKSNLSNRVSAIAQNLMMIFSR